MSTPPNDRIRHGNSKAGIAGILFDKDGTLIDFDRTWYPAYCQVADRVAGLSGYQVTVEDLMAAGGYDFAAGRWCPDSLLTSGTSTEILEFWLRSANVNATSAIMDELDGMFFRAAADNPVWLLEETATLLKSLRTAGLTLGVATMDDEYSAEVALAGFREAGHISFVCGADSGFGVKPDPGMVLAFCAAVDLCPRQVAVVGDSPRDLHMGRAADAGLVVGVTSGTSSRDDLEALADVVLDSVAGIPALLLCQ